MEGIQAYRKSTFLLQGIVTVVGHCCIHAAIRANNAMRLDLSAIHDQIQTLVIDRYNSGQLDECPLTRRDMSNIIDAFVRVLQGANHERIAYPEDPEK